VDSGDRAGWVLPCESKKEALCSVVVKRTSDGLGGMVSGVFDEGGEVEYGGLIARVGGCG